MSSAATSIALDNGVTQAEIGELICHLAFYGGWPAAASAVNVAQQAFDEHAARPGPG